MNETAFPPLCNGRRISKTGSVVCGTILSHSYTRHGEHKHPSTQQHRTPNLGTSTSKKTSSVDLADSSNSIPMSADQILLSIAELVESANNDEDPPSIRAKPRLPLTISTLRNILRRMPDVRTVGALIRSLHSNRRARADLVFALYGLGRPLEERLELIVDAMDLLGEHVAQNCDANTGPLDAVMEEPQNSGLGGSGEPVAGPSAEPTMANPMAETIANPISETITNPNIQTIEHPVAEPISDPAANSMTDPRFAGLATTSGNTAVAAETPLKELIHRMLSTSRIDTQLVRIFPNHQERRWVRARMERFAKRSIERWTFLAGIIWCLHVNGSFPADGVAPSLTPSDTPSATPGATQGATPRAAPGDTAEPTN
ncbi:hypothetical protein L211DRAFT_852924 [Terfezia boudieri ATCC MYA-4762]|uniref:Uncharacterized protein n=1 Tax=Terfezia boudieri ATCC MYA-4762 TaxID=1051890 RepID=A0A3N4LA10_9PEZI|nr:hypothetical protein L211DRAFT_852924 [Terfezia boudieri ATCC MYA-4762]